MADMEQPVAVQESAPDANQESPEKSIGLFDETPGSDDSGESTGGLLGEKTTDTDPPPTDEELEEIEYEGKKARVPKEMRDAFLRQRDYTQKTQEVAEARRMAEYERAQVQQYSQAAQANIRELAQLHNIEEQLTQFQNLNWAALNAQDPVKTQELHIRFTQLQTQRGQLQGALSQRQQAMAFQQQQQAAQRLEQGQRELERDIKGWSPELQGKLMQTAKAFGFRDDELAQVSDPRTVKLLHEAYLYRQSVAKSATKPAAAPLPKPVTKVGGGGATNAKPLSEMSPEEWAKRRFERNHKPRR